MNDEQVPALEEDDEEFRSFIQLYNFTVYHLVLQNKRELKSGRKFSWTDFHVKWKLAYLNTTFERSGLKLVQEETITENVIKDLDEIHDKKMTVIDDYVSRFHKSSFMQFAGVKHSKVYDAFVNGDTYI